MDYCLVIKNYILKNVLRYEKTLYISPGEIKDKVACMKKFQFC